MKTSQLARKANRFQIASNAIYQLKQIEQSNPSWRLEEAKVLWDQGEQTKAIQAARSLLETVAKTHKGTPLYANLNFSIGKWLASARSEGANKARENLQEAVDFFSQKSQPKSCVAYFTLAHYVDGLYQSFVAKLKSSEWRNSQDLRRHKEKELEACRQLLKGSNLGRSVNKEELQRHVITLTRQCELDKEAVPQL